MDIHDEGLAGAPASSFLTGGENSDFCGAECQRYGVGDVDLLDSATPMTLIREYSAGRSRMRQVKAESGDTARDGSLAHYMNNAEEAFVLANHV